MKTLYFLFAILIVVNNFYDLQAELPDTLKVGKHTVAEWNYIIDTTWGEGRTTEEKLQIFDIFWDYTDQHSVDFINNPIDWDSVKTVYHPRVETGVSRGEFNGIMQRMLYALKNNHNHINDTVVVTTPPLNGTPIVVIGCSGVNTLSDQSHFGAALTPLEDSSAVVFRVAENHPLGLDPGDRVLGYDGIPWKDIYPLLIQMNFPFSSYWKMDIGGGAWYRLLWHGSTNASDTHRWLRSSGLNWHLFDTIDIIKYGRTDTLHLPTSFMIGYNTPIPGNEQLPVNGIELPGSVDDGPDYWLSTIPVKWGIISGTNIGYIYVCNR